MQTAITTRLSFPSLFHDVLCSYFMSLSERFLNAGLLLNKSCHSKSKFDSNNASDSVVESIN